jgi:ParB family chromosome partitioning protein
MATQGSKRARLTESILGLARDQDVPPVPVQEAGDSAAGRGIVGKALELHKEGLVEQLARLERQRDEETRAGRRLVVIDADMVIDPLPLDRDRRAFADEAFAALKESIRANGQDTPIIVRPPGSGSSTYELAAGRRRLMACRELHLPVLARVLDLDDDGMLSLQYRENAEREDISPFERGQWLVQVAEVRKLSTTQMGRLFGLSQPSIVEYLKLGRLPHALTDNLSDPRELTIADARKLHAAAGQGAGLARMVKALATAGPKLATKAQVALALRAATREPVPEMTVTPSAMTVTDAQGRKLITVTRSGNQWVFRWAPTVDEATVLAVAREIPDLVARCTGKD